MDISLFDYHLPVELIAQYPSRERDQSRLMVVDRKSGTIECRQFRDIVGYLGPGDVLVVNNTRVFKARLLGHRVTGGVVEVFLVRRTESEPLVWEAMVRPSRRVRQGEQIHFYNSDTTERLSLTLKENRGNRWLVGFPSAAAQERIIERYGHVPLPQYIKRADAPEDVERYQTLFAKADKTGAVAAPTAGFHFTPSIIEAARGKGARIAELTLHVGPGTFKPVQVDDIERHCIDPEYSELTPQAADIINGARDDGGRVVAVGTTSVRTIESAPSEAGRVMPFSGDVDLYIRPGYTFKHVDHLVTNFHLPKSSLLILVSAFAGRELILNAYSEAIARRFRFYSYGDAMLIL